MGLYISKLKLYNWKNFRDCELDLQKRCFIIGANASGKSNLLDAIRFLRDIAKDGGGLQSAVEQRGGIKKIRCLAARKRTDVFIETELRNIDDDRLCWIYSLKIQNSGGGVVKQQPVILEEKVYSAVDDKLVLNRTDKTIGEDNETLKYTHLEQATANKEFRQIKETFEVVEYLNVIPQLVRESGSISYSSKKEDYYGRDFLNSLAKLPVKTRENYLKRINEVLKYVVPQLHELTFVRDEMGLPHIEARYIHWRDKGSKQDESLFSDGTLRIIGFLFSMLNGKGIILMEEPEINLNSGVVEQLPEFISKMQRYKNRQVLITTHSYDMLSNPGIGTAEVAVLETTKEGTLVKPLSSIPSLQAVVDAGFTVADAVIPHTKPENVSQMNAQIQD